MRWDKHKKGLQGLSLAVLLSLHFHQIHVRSSQYNVWGSPVPSPVPRQTFKHNVKWPLQLNTTLIIMHTLRFKQIQYIQQIQKYQHLFFPFDKIQDIHRQWSVLQINLPTAAGERIKKYKNKKTHYTWICRVKLKSIFSSLKCLYWCIHLLSPAPPPPPFFFFQLQEPSNSIYCKAC